MSLKDQIEAFSKTKKFANLVRTQMGVIAKGDTTAGGGAPLINSDGKMVVSKEGARQIVDDMMYQIWYSLPEPLYRSTPRHFYSIIPHRVGDKWDIRVRFDEEAVHRESIMPEQYPEGLDNVFKLFSHGSKPLKTSIYGHSKAYSQTTYVNKKNEIMYGNPVYNGSGPWYKTYYQHHAKYAGLDLQSYRGVNNYRYKESKQYVLSLPKGSRREPDRFLIDAIARLQSEWGRYGVEIKLNPSYYP